MTRARTSVSPAERLAAYRSKLLTDAQHDSAAARVAELVLAVPPCDAHEARVMASFVSRFLADVMPPEGGDPDDWLTEVHLARWAAQALAGPATEGTVKAAATAIRRVIRVKDGLPGRVARHTTTRRRGPDLDLAAVRAAVAGDAGATAALVAGLGTGLTGEAASGARVVTGPAGLELETRDGATRPLHNDTAGLAAAVAGVAVDAAGWDRLVELAAAVGVTLTHQNLRDAWTVGVLSSLPYLEAVGLGIGKKRLDWAAPHLARPPAGVVRDLLRGSTT